ncbi:hypothetical protein ACFYNO_11165 [Kitasatospora sp. NPDC006697]|uniref:hypothetical protein n=1 Tax=Kitasatospora sp. NPDC006697 TaxID=3364020 RepID=UPI00369CBE5A
MTSGVGPDLAGAVVQELAQSAARSGGDPGTALGDHLLGQAWQRLLAHPRWAPAAEQLARTPGDPQAHRNLTLAVAELLAYDPVLAAALRASWTPPPLPPPAPPARTGRNAAILAGSLVVIAGLIALGLQYGSHPFSSGHRATALDHDRLRTVLPALADLPAGWTPDDSPNVETPDCSNASGAQQTEACHLTTGVAEVSFKDSRSVSLGFGVFSTTSTADADRLFDAMLASTNLTDNAQPYSFATVGDRSTALTSDSDTEVIARVGTTVLLLDYNTGRADTAAFTPLARMLATRSQQAQDGHLPSAKA